MDSQSPTPSPTDEELVRRWQAGERREEAFALLERRYASQLIAYFHGMGFDRETCHDLAQEAFFRAFCGLDDFRRDASLRTWLLKIARTTALKKLRHDNAKKRRGEAVPLDEPDASEPRPNPAETVEDATHDPLARLLDEETHQQVRSAVAALPDADRRMTLFRMWHGLEVREIAQVMKKPEGTVKSGLSRIRKALGEKLGGVVSDLPP